MRSGIGSLPVLDVVGCNGEVVCRGDVEVLLGLDVGWRGDVGVLPDLDVVAKKASVRGVKDTGARGGGGGGLLRT